MMEQSQPERHIGRKVWYGVAIFLSILILLLSVAGAVGTWVVEKSLSDLTVTLFVAVEDAAGGLRQVAGRIDQGAGEVRAISSEVSNLSAQISENVENKGLIALLLPEEQEQKLASTIQSVDETLNSIADVVTAGLDLYRSIDGLPLVSLPKPNQERIDQMQQSVADTQAEIASMRQSIQVFRTGVADEIDKVTQAADKVTESMNGLSSDVSGLDSDLAAVQDFANGAQSAVPLIFASGAVLITLLLVYGAYTQVDVIRLYVIRWRRLGIAAEMPEIEAGAVEVEVGEATGKVEKASGIDDKEGSTGASEGELKTSEDEAQDTAEEDQKDT